MELHKYETHRKLGALIALNLFLWLISFMPLEFVVKATCAFALAFAIYKNWPQGLYRK